MKGEAGFRPKQAATVLVPIDGSGAAMAALPVARMVARMTGATVHIIHATTEPLSHEELFGKLRLRPPDVRGVVVEQVTDPIAEAIVREAGQRQSLFIVMTTHGKVPVRGLGPIALAVLAQAPCPVVFVRPEAALPREGEGAPLHRILVPLDGAPETSAAAAPAIRFAESSGAELGLVLVATAGVAHPTQRGTLVTPRYVDQPHHEWPAWAQEFIRRTYHGLGKRPAVPIRLLPASGKPAEQILRAASEWKTDLIVLVWRGRLDEEHGAIIKTVLLSAPCPILVLRAPKTAGNAGEGGVPPAGGNAASRPDANRQLPSSFCPFTCDYGPSLGNSVHLEHRPLALRRSEG